MRVRLLHNRLARRLARSRRSQNAWAQRLELSRGHLSDLVKGKHPYPSAATRKKLLDGLDLAFDDLFEIEESGASKSALEKTREAGPRAGAGTPGPLLVQAVLAALLVAICTGSWYVVDQLFLAPLPYPDAQRLLVVRQKEGERIGPSPSWPNFIDIRQRTRLLESMAAYVSADGLPLRDASGSFAVAGAIVTEDFFDTLGISTHLGRLGEHKPGGGSGNRAPMPIAIGFNLWRERYESDPSVLGSEIEMHGIQSVVSAVLPEGFNFPGESQIWAPHSFLPAGVGSRTAHNLTEVIARLKKDVSRSEAALELDAIASRLAALHSDLEQNFGLAAVPLRTHLNSSLQERVLLTAAVALLLWILALQTVIHFGAFCGAGNLGWVSCLAAALVGWPAGLGLGLLLKSALNVSWLDHSLAQHSGISLAGLAAVSSVVALSFGLIPAIYRRRSAHRGPSRFFILAGALTPFLVLLGTAIHFGYQWHTVSNVDLGFEPAGLIEVRLNLPGQTDADWPPLREQVFALHDRLLERIESLQGVKRAALAFSPPLSDALKVDSLMLRADDPQGSRPLGNFDFRVVSREYFSLMGMPLLAGRGFRRGDDDGSQLVAVANESLAALVWGSEEEAIGKQVLVPGQSFETGDNPRPLRIIGVVPDVRQRGLSRTPRPALYTPYTQHPVRAPYMRLLVRASDSPQETAALVWQVVYEVSPEIPSSQPRILQDLIEARTRPLRFKAVLSIFSAGLGALLCAAAIFLAHRSA
ncbi:MAG TPA: ABC transporter permease [Acidobacteriota bacterium]|nr:ABC transporter permease [Acidobacteriota bacterium]